MLAVEGEFEPFAWKGKSTYSRSFVGAGDGGILSRIKAHDVRGNVTLGGVRRGVWEIPLVEISRLDLTVGGDAADSSNEAGESSIPDFGNDGDDDSPQPDAGLFSRLIPSEVEIQRIVAKDVSFNLVSPMACAFGRGISVTMTPTAAQNGFAVSGRGGELAIDGIPRLALVDFVLRTGDDRVYVDRAEFRLNESGHLLLSGQATTRAPIDLHLSGHLDGLDISELLEPNPARELRGCVSGSFTISGSPSEGSGIVISGDIDLKQGSLEALPLLERIDSLAGTTRFRKLNLTRAEARFTRSADELEVGDYQLESAGLGCLKGRLDISSDGTPAGHYMLGVSPDAIKYMPVAEKRVIESVFSHTRDSAFAIVFADSPKVEPPPDGYRWAVAEIDPSSRDPYTADLRRQLINAGGLAMWAELQGMPDRVVEAAGKLAKTAAEHGADLGGLIAEQGFGSATLQISERLIEDAADHLGVDDPFRDEAALPKAIIDSGFDVIRSLLPLAPAD